MKLITVFYFGFPYLRGPMKPNTTARQVAAAILFQVKTTHELTIGTQFCWSTLRILLVYPSSLRGLSLVCLNKPFVKTPLGIRCYPFC